MQSSERAGISSRVKHLVLALSMLGLGGHALGNEVNLSDLIRTIKSQKEAELDPAKAQRQPARPATAVARKPPRLWSITGINQNFTALLVFDNKVYEVQSDETPQWIDGWRVTSVHAFGVELERPGRNLSLSAPDSSTRAEVFLQQLGQTPTSTSTPVSDSAEVLAQTLPLPAMSSPESASGNLPIARALTPAQMRASALSDTAGRRTLPQAQLRTTGPVLGAMNPASAPVPSAQGER